jgi:hypothetical protein
VSTPDITPAQVVSTIGGVIGVLLAAAVIDGHTAKLIVGLASIVIPFGWQLADAIIRHGRSKVAAANASADAWNARAMAEAVTKAAPRSRAKKAP